MADSKELYLGIAEQLHERHPEFESGQMFGMPTLKVGKKAFAGLFNDDMVFKLDKTTLDKALKIPDAKLFDPMGGRPMKAWAQIPPASSGEWLGLATSAMQFVAE